MSGRLKTNLDVRDHNNGSQRETGYYHRGKKADVWMAYCDDAPTASEESYCNGKRLGDWDYYKENGTLDLERSGTYTHDKKAGKCPSVGCIYNCNCKYD